MQPLTLIHNRGSRDAYKGADGGTADPRRQNQLRLFARAQRDPRWVDLSPDIQQKVMPLLAQ
jgi:hypothetical protein